MKGLGSEMDTAAVSSRRDCNIRRDLSGHVMAVAAAAAGPVSSKSSGTPGGRRRRNGPEGAAAGGPHTTRRSALDTIYATDRFPAEILIALLLR